MEYVPHAQARRLASGRTRSIALHYPLANPQLFSERLEMSFVSGIAMGAALEEYYFTLFTGELSPVELRRISKSSIADGLILMQVALDDWRVETLRELDYPFAMIGRCQDNTGLSFIDFDFERALVDAFDFLVALGHSRIASSRTRLRGAWAGWAPPSALAWVSRLRSRSTGSSRSPSSAT